MTATTLPVVSRFEADLLRLLRFLLGHLPREQVQNVLRQRTTAPRGISKSAARLVEDTLRKGLICFLVHGGGWRREAFLRNGTAAAGHPWERIPIEERELRFSGTVLSFLIWLTAERPGEARQAWTSQGQMTLVDQLFFLRAAEHLEPIPEIWGALRRSTPFAGNPLVRLAMPWALEPETTVYSPIFGVPGPAILECLQDWFASRWAMHDAMKSQISDWKLMRSQGEVEAAVLAAFLQAAERTDRRDLGRFLLRAIGKRLNANSQLDDWIGGLAAKRPLKLADRSATMRAALSMIQQIETFAHWDRVARTIGYFDEGYAAGQFWKAAFEAADGPRLLAEWRRLSREMDPLTSEAR